MMEFGAQFTTLKAALDSVEKADGLLGEANDLLLYAGRLLGINRPVGVPQGFDPCVQVELATKDMLNALDSVGRVVNQLRIAMDQLRSLTLRGDPEPEPGEPETRVQ